MFRDFDSLVSYYEQRLKKKDNFDILKRNLNCGGKRAVMYAVDGLIKDEVLEKMIEFLLKATPEQLSPLKTSEEFAEKFISYIETDITSDDERAVTSVLSGMLLLIVEGYKDVFLLDIRTYPARGVEEPGDDRVLRGAHDGFTETLNFNTALIRRRIRDASLIMKHFSVGEKSKTDVVLSYMEERADAGVIKKLTELLSGLKVNALSLSQASLNEALVKKGWWYNPFPKVRYTERPDVACASILDGQVLILIDNSPTVIILPVSVFDFVEDANDYYFPPLVGTYLRTVRSIVFILTMLLVPVWFLMTKYPLGAPEWLRFAVIPPQAKFSYFWQIILFEIIIDALKLASLNTPSSLSNSFAVVGALILGEFAVSTGLFDELSILFMAITAIGNFTQPSFELGYAFKMVRILLVLFTEILGGWGFAAGIIISAAICASTKTPVGGSYFYPLIPFNFKRLSSILVRRKRNDDD